MKAILLIGVLFIILPACRTNNRPPKDVVIEVPTVQHDTIYVDGADLLVVAVRDETISVIYLDDTTEFNSPAAFETYLQQNVATFASLTVQLETPPGQAPEKVGEVMRLMTEYGITKFRMKQLDE